MTVFTLPDSDLSVDLMHNLKHFKESDFDNCFKNGKMIDPGKFTDIDPEGYCV